MQYDLRKKSGHTVCSKKQTHRNPNTFLNCISFISAKNCGIFPHGMPVFAWWKPEERSKTKLKGRLKVVL